jgi:hypothetical protein
MRQQRRRFRFIGFMFALVGGALAAFGTPLLFDPTSTLTCNGEVSTSIGCKASFVASGYFFLVVGLCLVFVKPWRLDRIFVWSQSVRSMFARKRDS